MELEIVKRYIALQQMRGMTLLSRCISKMVTISTSRQSHAFSAACENAVVMNRDDAEDQYQVFEDVARHLAVVTISDSGKD